MTRPWSLLKVLLFAMAVGVLFRLARLAGGFTLWLAVILLSGVMVFVLSRMHRQALEKRRSSPRKRGKISRTLDSFNDAVYPLLAWATAGIVASFAGMGGVQLSLDIYPESQTLSIVAGSLMGLCILSALAVGADLPGTGIFSRTRDRESGRDSGSPPQ